MTQQAPQQVFSSADARRQESLQRVEAWLELEQMRRRVEAQEGRIEAVEELGGARTQYRYNDHGDLIEIIESNGRSTCYAYDFARRLVHVEHADGGATRYTYSKNGRLLDVQDRGAASHFEYDPQDRLEKICRPGADTVVNRYDAQGRLIQARTGEVSTQQEYDSQGRITAIHQSVLGVSLTVRLEYGEVGCLANLEMPGGGRVRYTWNAQGRPETVAWGEHLLAQFMYDDETKLVETQLGNGVTVVSQANLADARPKTISARRGDSLLHTDAWEYSQTGEIIADSHRQYSYDPLGRLIQADEPDSRYWRYEVDLLDNRLTQETAHGVEHYEYSLDGLRLERVISEQGDDARLRYDPWGRLTGKSSPTKEWVYRYDAAGNLRQVLCNGNRVARFTYDAKRRLALAELPNRVERYLYGPADELLAVADDRGCLLRQYVRTPLGVLAELHGAPGEEVIYYRHDDPQGTLRALSDSQGQAVGRFEYSPYGEPEVLEGGFQPVFGGRSYLAEIGLYWFGARWYDPGLGRFLTPDSYTAAPDDLRLVNAFTPASQQVVRRLRMLNDWLRQPRARNPYAFCSNDPIGRMDPNGHWSFGGVLLMLLGAIWTLPNTLFGLLVEITCLVGEVLRWLVWLVSLGHASWETPGFDAAASGNLNAFALVFSGGWLGSFSSLLGITFGNVFFVYKNWRTSPHITTLPAEVHPAGHQGEVTLQREDVLYEHELRHTNQYGWFGPFFHLGLPLFGVYEWDVIINGYQDAWTERDARRHSEEEWVSPTSGA